MHESRKRVPMVIHTMCLVRCLVVSVWLSILRCMNLWLVLWTRQDAEYRIWTQISRAQSPVVEAADCKSAGPWFNSGWRTLFSFVTWCEKLTDDDFLMINIVTPITTSGRLQESQLTWWRSCVRGTALWIPDTRAAWRLQRTLSR